MSEKRLIKIPRQIRLKTEFFEGFGMEELIKTLIAGGISAVISYIFYKITGQTIIATLIVIGVIVVSVIVLIKGNNNFSMAETIKNIVNASIKNSPTSNTLVNCLFKFDISFFPKRLLE